MVRSRKDYKAQVLEEWPGSVCSKTPSPSGYPYTVRRGRYLLGWGNSPLTAWISAWKRSFYR